MQQRNARTTLMLILALALFLRSFGIPWGIQNGDSFLQPDEKQHVRIARNFIQNIDNDFFTDAPVNREENAQGFGIQLGCVLYPLLKISGLPVLSDFSIFTGRILSVLYSLLLILLLYVISSNLFSDRKVALMSALLLSLIDVNVTYSHYSLPDIPHIFWTYLSLFLIIVLITELRGSQDKRLFTKKLILLYVAVPLSMAVAFSLKYDIIPFLIFSFVLIYLTVRRQITTIQCIVSLSLISVLCILFFMLSTGFSVSFDDLRYSQNFQYKENFHGINKDNHMLFNPVVYFFVVLGGTNIFIMTFFILSLILLLKDKKGKQIWHIVFGAYVISGFLLLWLSDVPVVRRANIFMPYIAMVAGYGMIALSRNFERGRKMNLIIIIGLIYSLAFTVSSQVNFLSDSRYRASSYIRSHLRSKTIAYSEYAYVRSMPPGQSFRTMLQIPDIIVLHETNYSRYWKSLTTPFKKPECCDEVWHCVYHECVNIQNIFAGKTPYRLLKAFRSYDVFPERILFKELFRTYEIFTGDTLIYMKPNA